MKIYIDLVLFINFCYDFLLLLTVDFTLKRHKRIIRHLISALIGSLSIILLFLPLNKLLLFLFKIIVSFIMIIISFEYKNIKYFFLNTFYLYMCSVILGGFLYLLNNEFSYKKEGLIFYYDGLSINYVLLLIIAPVILFLYYLEHKRYKTKINCNYKISFKYNNYVYTYDAYLDTANKLRDPISKKYVILISKKVLKPFINIRSPIYVVYKGINNTGIIECFKPDYIKVNNIMLTNYIIGIVDNEFNLNGSDCLLNNKIMEDICLEN